MAALKPIRVLVADGRPLVRELLDQAISRSAEFETTMVPATRDAVVKALGHAKHDVLLFGANAVDLSVPEFVQAALLASSKTSVLVLVSDDCDARLLEALEAGASGFVTLDMPLKDVKERIRAAAAHQTVLPADFAQRVLLGMHTRPRQPVQRSSRPHLTARETETLALLIQGLGNAEIAAELGVSTNTVKNHLYSIYRKLGVTSRGQAFATATELGLAG